MMYDRFIIDGEYVPKDPVEAMRLHNEIWTLGIRTALANGGVVNDHHGVGIKLGRMMKERSGLFQQQITGYDINRHTDNQDMKIYLSAQALDIIDTMVNTVTYHDEPLAYADVEGVTFWQSIKTPNAVNVTPSYTDTDGTVKTGTAQNVQNIFGLMFDRDAIAINRFLYEVRNTPLNASGLYYNTYLHDRSRYLNDLTEKGIVLLLD
jgi:hypothetical protein